MLRIVTAIRPLPSGEVKGSSRSFFALTANAHAISMLANFPTENNRDQE
jgi:hypothetical protein